MNLLLWQVSWTEVLHHGCKRTSSGQTANMLGRLITISCCNAWSFAAAMTFRSNSVLGGHWKRCTLCSTQQAGCGHGMCCQLLTKQLWCSPQSSMPLCLFDSDMDMFWATTKLLSQTVCLNKPGEDCGIPLAAKWKRCVHQEWSHCWCYCAEMATC